MELDPERKFLHDVANPMGTVLLLAGSVLESLEQREASDPEDVKALRRVVEVLEQVRKMLQDRRQALIDSSKCS